MINEKLGLSVDTVPGEKGEFTVLYDGIVIAKKENEFPGPQGVIDLLQQKLDIKDS